MADETRTVSINGEASNLLRTLRNVQRAFENLGNPIQVTDDNIRKVERTMDRSATAMSKSADVIQKLQARVQNLSSENRGLASTSAQTSSQLSRVQGQLSRLERITGINPRALDGLNKASRSALEATSALAKLEAGWLRLEKLPAMTEAGNNLAATIGKHGRFKYGGYDVTRATDEELKALKELERQSRRTFMDDVDDELRRRAEATRDTTRATRGLSDATGELGKKLDGLDNLGRINALRYAMYDVSNTFQRISDVTGRAVLGVLDVGIEFEKNFANVQRTSQATGLAIDRLRDQFLNLQTTIPVTSEDLATIGTLAAQMGIAANEIAGFTEITAKFAATSNVSVDESATALARVGMLLREDVQGDYERLASAILKTGINAIATEQQIVRGTTQIAGMGKAAGLTATEVVALSSAMSSLGMSPELQRSIITSSFTRILSAVRGSTDAAAKFGKVLGMTGQEFKDAWDNDTYNTFSRFLQAVAASPNSIQTLQELRLASQRLTPNLLRLGQSYELMQKTMRDTQEGWDEGSELQTQYNVIAETTAAHLQTLQGAFEKLLQVLSKDFIEVVGDVASAFTDLVSGFADLVNNPVGRTIGSLVIGLGALAAAGFGVMNMITLGAASFLGFDFVLRTMHEGLAGNTGLIGLFGSAKDRLTKWMAESVIGSRVMQGFTLAVNAAKLAVAGLAAALAVGVAAQWAYDLAREAEGADRSLDGLIHKLEKVQGTAGGQNFGESLASGISPLYNVINSFQDAINPQAFDLKDLATWAREVPGLLKPLRDIGPGQFSDIRKLDDDLESLLSHNPEEGARQYLRLRDAWVRAGGAAEDLAKIIPNTDAALQLMGESAGDAGASAMQFAEGMVEDEEATIRAAVSLDMLIDSLGLVSAGWMTAEDSLKAFTGAIMAGMQSWFDYGGMLEAAYGKNGGGLQAFSKSLSENLTESEEWSEGLRELVKRGASTLAQEFAALGPASSEAVKDALKLSDGDLAELEENMALAAMYSSQAFADAFAQDTALMTNIYKQMLSISPGDAQAAAKELFKAMRSGGSLTASEILGLSDKYKFEIPVEILPESVDTSKLSQIETVTPINIPVTYGVIDDNGQPVNDVTTYFQQYVVGFDDGSSVIIDVDPNTEEGKRKIDEWRDNESKSPVSLGILIDTSKAEAAIRDAKARLEGAAIIKYTKAPSGYYPDAQHYAKGGLINRLPKFATGGGFGMFRGPGTGTSDSILARVSNGEFINTARSVRYYGAKFFEDLNRMRIPRFADGGLIGGGSGVGAGTVVNATVNQFYPTTSDPIEDLKRDAENVILGIW